VLGASQGTPPLQAILQAHKAWKTPPASIQILGSVLRGNAREPVTITATNKEEAVVDYGNLRRVATASRHFKDDGTKATIQPTLSGFTQLDATSVFLLAQLAGRPVRVDRPEPAKFQGIPAFRVHVSSDRSEVHYRQYKVRDELDLFVTESGLLAGIERTFYRERPLFTVTMRLAFSDYRDANGVLLPYRIDRYMNGHNVESIAVDAYAFDIPTTSALFEPRRTR